MRISDWSSDVCSSDLHRVVHGGTRFTEATLVTEEVEEQIGELSALAPLHNPVNLAGIRATRSAIPPIAHVPVFDTAFHQTLAPAASPSALPARLAQRHGIPRHGLHVNSSPTDSATQTGTKYSR